MVRYWTTLPGPHVISFGDSKKAVDNLGWHTARRMTFAAGDRTKLVGAELGFGKKWVEFRCEWDAVPDPTPVWPPPGPDVHPIEIPNSVPWYMRSWDKVRWRVWNVDWFEGYLGDSMISTPDSGIGTMCRTFMVRFDIYWLVLLCAIYPTIYLGWHGVKWLRGHQHAPPQRASPAEPSLGADAANPA